VLRALGLGDLLTALPALRGLARAFPDHRRVLAAPSVLEPLVRLAGAGEEIVDEVVDTGPLAPLDPSLHGAAVAVNLHGRGPQSHRVLLDAAPARLIAFAHPAVPESAEGPPWAAGEHEVLGWCRLLQASGIPTDPSALDLPAPPVSAPAGATVVHPGAGAAEKRWPASRWAELAIAVSAVGHRVVVTGSAEEAGLAQEVATAAGLPQEAVLAGRTDLLGLASVVAGARQVLSGDTGIAHLATALGTPSVVLFGPVPPSAWGPPPDRPQHVALWSGPEGLLEITVDQVLAAAGVGRHGVSPRRTR
jgi:ADP-heptose:LPS heptosyltransferase